MKDAGKGIGLRVLQRLGQCWRQPWRAMGPCLLGAVLVTGLAACGGGDHAPTTTKATVGTGGGQVTGAGGIVIDIPAGALDASVDLQVTNAGDGHEPALPYSFTPISGIYTITPHIEPFNAPVTVTMPVPGVTDGTAVYFALARPGEDWVISRATASGGKASLLTTHFSYVVIGSQTLMSMDNVSCFYAAGGCNPIPPPNNLMELYASENLTAAHPQWDGMVGIIKPTLLTFQSLIKPAARSPFVLCPGFRVELEAWSWRRQNGAWNLNFHRIYSHDGYNSPFVQPLQVDASMNGWLILNAAYSCLGARSDGATYTIWRNLFRVDQFEVNIPVGAPPAIGQQPQAQSVTAGQSATFSVTASGTAPLSYQWYRNGTAIAGATAADYTLSNAQQADSGATFTVTVTDGNGNTTTSSGAALTVTAAALQITLQPQTQSVAVGQSASFSVSATGTAPLSYQWYRNGTAIAGATAANYTLSNAQPTDSGATFTVTVTDGNGSTVTSGGATLTVTNPVVAACTGSNNTGWCRTFDDTTAASVAGFQGASATFTSLDFGSSAVGLAASQTSSPGLELLRTVDGGNTWTHVTQAPFAGTGSVGINFNEVAFADANTAVAIGSSAGLSKIYRSTNAGVSWVEVGSYTPPSSLNAPRTPGLLQYIRFTDALTGVISAQGSFLRTTDGGANWALVTPNLSFNYSGGTATNTDIRSMARIPGTTTLRAFVIDLMSAHACLMQSTDGGLTWSVSTVLPASPALDAVGAQHLSFANANVGVLLDNNSGGTIYRTTDGGQTWAQVSTFPATQVLLKADGTGVAVSTSLSNGSNIAYTTDFGATWHTVLSGTTNALAAVASPASGKFAAAGGNAIEVNNQGGAGP